MFYHKRFKKSFNFHEKYNHPTRQTFAWWSDSETLVDMMSTLYDLSWEKGESIY